MTSFVQPESSDFPLIDLLVQHESCRERIAAQGTKRDGSY
jgi:hypothetical protein